MFQGQLWGAFALPRFVNWKCLPLYFVALKIIYLIDIKKAGQK